MSKWWKIVVPVVLIAVGMAAAAALVANRPQAKPELRAEVAPLVRTVSVEPRDMRLVVRAEGTVAPQTEIELVPEVGGRVIFSVSEMTAGGFFRAGQTLIRIDPRDYRLAVQQAEAEVAGAGVRLERELAEGAVALGEWAELGKGDPPALVRRTPQLAEARAALAAAEAVRERARLDLERTEIRAPFNGRVLSESADVGQYVSPGRAIARLYGVDVAEVRLALADDELAHVDLPLSYDDGRVTGAEPEVVLWARFGGRRHRWDARIVRTEGELDPRSRMVHAVAEVRGPYARDDGSERPPLAVGMFVEAEIQGRMLHGAFSVPRTAMRTRNSVLVVDEESRLRFRDVEVVRYEREQVIVRAGLSGGERVCISPLDIVVDGMAVRVVAEEPAR